MARPHILLSPIDSTEQCFVLKSQFLYKSLLILYVTSVNPRLQWRTGHQLCSLSVIFIDKIVINKKCIKFRYVILHSYQPKCDNWYQENQITLCVGKTLYNVCRKPDSLQHKDREFQTFTFL